MAASPQGGSPGNDKGRMPRNRARLLLILAVVLVLVVIFGYMLLVSLSNT